MLAAREAAEKGIIPDPRIVALAIAMKTTPPLVPPGVPIVGSAVPPPKLPPVQPNHTEKTPVKKKIPTPVPIAPAPAPSSPPVTAPASASISCPIPVAPSAPNHSGVVEKDTPMETDSVEPAGESHSQPTQTASTPPVINVNTNTPKSPPITIEIEPAESAPSLPPKKGRLRSRAPSKKAKALNLLLASTSHASASAFTARRSVTPPKIPTPPFGSRRLSPLAPQSQSQLVFPLLNVFTQAAGPEVAPSQTQPPSLAQPSARPSSPPATQSQTPSQLPTLRPSISGPSDAEGKDKGGRKGFDPQLLRRLVDDKEDTKRAEVNKPVINRLFAVPTTSHVASSSTVPPTPTLLRPSTSFGGSASVGTRFGSFGLTKVTSFGASGFGVSVDAAVRPAPVPAPGTGGFGAFGSRAAAGAGAGFASFGTVATGSGPSASNFGFTTVFSNQASASPIQTSNVRGEGDDDNEQDRDSDTDMGYQLGADVSVDVEEDPVVRKGDSTGEPMVFSASQPQAQSRTPARTESSSQSSQSFPQSSVTTSTPAPQHPESNVTLTNHLPTQLAPSDPAHSALTATCTPTQPIVTPPSPLASPVQGTVINTLPPTSLFYLDAKPRRRDHPSALPSGPSSASGPTRLIEQTIRKYVTLDPVTLVPTIVDLDQMVGDLQSMRLVVHHNFLPRTPPKNGDYRRGLENLLKQRRRKRGEPRTVYRGAGDDDLGSVTESD